MSWGMARLNNVLEIHRPTARYHIPLWIECEMPDFQINTESEHCFTDYKDPRGVPSAQCLERIFPDIPRHFYVLLTSPLTVSLMIRLNADKAATYQ